MFNCVVENEEYLIVNFIAFVAPLLVLSNEAICLN